MLKVLMRYVIFLLVARVYCQKLELSAFEYRRLKNESLDLGKCPLRRVQYQDGSAVVRCNFPARRGHHLTRQKKVNSTKVMPVYDVSQLLQQVGMCDDKSADFFGLLAEGNDCAANVIASKLSFTHKTAVWMFSEHYRPQVDILKPNSKIDGVQKEFHNYLNNSYYTESIGYGTQEVLIVELHFKSAEDAKRAYNNKYYTRKMSQKLETVGIPRKVKVIRYSTADNVLHVKTFRGVSSFIDAMRYVKDCERRMSRIILEIANGWRKDHLKYTFKAYEIGQIGPIALGVTTITESEKRSLWESVARLQVDAQRTYATNKRYRKFCKRKRDKYCLHMRKYIKDLKETITQIHTRRRDWLKTPHEQQVSFVKNGKNYVKLLKTQIIILAKELRKMMKKKS